MERFRSKKATGPQLRLRFETRHKDLISDKCGKCVHGEQQDKESGNDFRQMMILEKMKSLRSACVIACVTGLLLLSGCASFQVTVPDSDPARLKGYTEGYLKKTMHAFFWGLLPNPRVLEAACDGQGINDIIVYRTLAHDFAGVITLGLWMPTEVYFRCKARTTDPGGSPSPSKKRSKSRRLS